ncbi:hypothetical protein PN451_10385 [Dolichospermum planctonicum CS-1226]|uniref:O-antigen polymerase n=1 Tax=Dolichospermum planctonicum CS-1226 TaxID=3021751 RepID=A0ABT5AG47_9CYAN|nr:hypothetical protein [Dolichospermum planctonicum]MDB9536231.1 hypothetical protein [Dolichospermum planctonicum CS-1226]
MNLLLPLLVLIVFIFIVWLSSRNWRKSVKFALIIVVLEGALRKWVLPQASDLIYFLKDIVLLGAYLKFYSSSEPKYHGKAGFFTMTLFLCTGWCAFQIFNPSLGSPIVGLFGLKAYLFYIPLMWMIPTLFESQEELYQFLRNYLLLVIPVAILAIAQFFSPTNSPLNVYASGGVKQVATAGENVRVTGTFPYIAGYSTYMSFCFSLLIPLISLPQPKKWQIITFIEALLVTGTSFMTGARGLLLFEILFLLGYFSLLWLTKPSKAIHNTKNFILPTLLISAVVPVFFQKAIQAFYTRVTTASDSGSFAERAFYPFTAPVAAMRFKGFDSYGIGATHPAIPALRSALRIYSGEALPSSEGETGRVVLEIGIFGFILWYALRLYLIISLLGMFLKLKTPFLRNLALAVFLFHTINLTGQLIFNTTFGVYYWFFSGFIFLFPQLEYQQLLLYRNQLQQKHV